MSPPVTLRRLTPADAASWLADPGPVHQWPPVADWPTEQDVIVLRLAAQSSDPWPCWLVIHDAAVIGTVVLTGPADATGEAEIGYVLAPACRGRGLGRAAVAVLLRELSEHHGVRRVRARVAPANLASTRLLTALQFTPVDTDGPDGTDVVWQRELNATR